MTHNPTPDSNELGTSNVPRRTIVAGAAWSIPVIATAVAAPIASASGPCNPSTLDWSRDYGVTNPYRAGQGNIQTPAGQTVPFWVTATYPTAAGVTPNTDSLYINQETGMLALSVKSTIPKTIQPSEGQYARMTITFGQPVTNLSFRIFDVDLLEWTRAAGAGLQASPGPALSTYGNWVGYPHDFEQNIMNYNNSVRYDSAGPITSFIVDFWRPTVGGGIFLSDLTLQIPC